MLQKLLPRWVCSLSFFKRLGLVLGGVKKPVSSFKEDCEKGFVLGLVGER